jgi:hypothetical protein
VIDHLVLGASDLSNGIEFVERLTGVKPAIGGRHTQLGTHNALLPLGPRQYLEVLAPDPSQDCLIEPLNDLLMLDAPRLIKWAVATTGIDAALDILRVVGFADSAIENGTRTTSDNRILRWRQIGFLAETGPGIPFVIEWDRDSLHPADGSPSGCTLLGLKLEHPDPETLGRLLAQLNVSATLRKAPVVRLEAVLDTPRGQVNLSS